MSGWSCIKTLEGHSASVLRIGFITAGMQMVSTGGDGLFKVWTIKSNECVNTFDQHTDKIWAMAVHPDHGTVVTGASDSTINIWKDKTADVEQEALMADEEKELQRQELMNAARGKEYKRAVELALELAHPHQMYNLIRDMIDEDQLAALEGVMVELPDDKLVQLLEYVRAWNTKAKQSEVAQRVLSTLFQSPGGTAKLQALHGMKEMLEGLIPYSDRHLQRVSKLIRGTYFIDYIVQGMSLTSVLEDKLEEPEHPDSPEPQPNRTPPRQSPRLAARKRQSPRLKALPSAKKAKA
eukprot:TRINITY_DN10421_c0_g1_i3.p1 TRINITY_DN10421_c0_g1~~TRINITY_DN10421_c0_g1_i3.p1  ORF type:complete len:295 (-),score=82.73 TRINITY_DN10421_c0_g1_i3:296-1180(-)